MQDPASVSICQTGYVSPVRVIGDAEPVGQDVMRPGERLRRMPTEGEQERRSGLPAEVSSLVGREPQIAAVLERLRSARVVTLTAGAGGCGKTRVALQWRRWPKQASRMAPG